MKYYLSLIASLAVFAWLLFGALPASATNKNHTCQGRHNCNTTENVTNNYNTSSDASATSVGIFGQKQGQQQGQKQGQQQGQGQEQSNFNAVGQGQGQTAHNSGVNTDVSFSQNVNHEAPDLSEAPGNPAAVYVDACSNGLSASGPGYGATFGRNDPFCKWVALSNSAYITGQYALSREYLNEAESTLRRQTFVSRFFDWIPVVGWLF